MRYSFHPDAESEFNQAIVYYDECEANLGYEFAVEVYSSIERIVANPQVWPIIEGEVRRALVRRFPYGILYAADSDEILIVSVMHLHRNPDYWKYRV